VTLRTFASQPPFPGSVCRMTVYVFLTSLQRVFLGARNRRGSLVAGWGPRSRRRRASALSSPSAAAGGLFGLKHICTKPYSPKTNGKAERSSRQASRRMPEPTNTPASEKMNCRPGRTATTRLTQAARGNPWYDTDQQTRLGPSSRILIRCSAGHPIGANCDGSPQIHQLLGEIMQLQRSIGLRRDCLSQAFRVPCRCD
jgi:hypothetical protein